MFSSLLIKKGITNDIDSAIKIVQKRLKTKDKDRLFGLDDLNQMFCASILKESLIEAIKNIEQIGEGIGIELKQSN